MHGRPMHLVWNMLLVWFVGPIIEHTYGWKTFLWIYFVGAIFGGFATILIDLSTQGTFLPVVGASAAALSLMMVWTMQAPRQTVMFCGI
ncbi:rhomboid family intramembrane serine protease, partial [Escherichia coli]|uniref:rhomboid family intramembrane serine protease n=1 Tax=Escherichia coli TaxID=562 RepID=UPI003079FBAB